MLINNRKINIKRYSSKEMKLKNDYLQSFIKNNKVDILFNNEISIFELLLLLDYYKSLKVKVNLILSYLPYQRMDHPNTNNTETVKNVANIFNSLNLDSLSVCEPHCELSYFKNAKRVNIIEKMFDKVTTEIGFNKEKDLVIFTDKGSVKKYSNLFSDYAYGDKTRDDSTGLIDSYKLIGNIKPNQKLLIIDDIISSGDTISEILSLLKNYNNEIYIFCAHLEKNKFNKRLTENAQVKRIFASNSLTKRQSKKIRLFSVEDIIYG